MSEKLRTIRLSSANAFIGLTGKVDYEKCVVHGVSLITGDTEAEGHELQVDDTTTKQILQLAKKNGKVAVYLDHGSGIEKLNGYVDNFFEDGVKVRGDWHLLKSHKETPTMLERAELQPETFGLSVAFKGKGVMVAGGKKAARAEKLLSVDVVPRPAANADGLFGAKDDDEVDTQKNIMAKNNKAGKEQNGDGDAGEPSLQDVLNAINTLGERVGQIEGVQKQVVDHLNSQPAAEDLEATYNELVALSKMTDEELAEKGVTRDQVNAAVKEWNENYADADTGDGDGNGDGDGSTAGDGEGEGARAGAGEGATAGAGAAAGAGAGAAGGGSTAETFAAKRLRAEIIELKAKVNHMVLEKERERDEAFFAELESNVETLEMQRDKLVEFAEKAVARIEMLELAVRTGTRPVKPGMEGIKLFSTGEDGKLHKFQEIVKGYLDTKKAKNEAEAILLAVKEHPAEHADWVKAGAGQVIRA